MSDIKHSDNSPDDIEQLVANLATNDSVESLLKNIELGYSLDCPPDPEVDDHMICNVVERLPDGSFKNATESQTPSTKVGDYTPCIRQFRKVMVTQLVKNQAKGQRQHWRSLSSTQLMSLLEKQIDDLRQSILERSRFAGQSTPNELLSKAADVANVAMMIADACGSLPDCGNHPSNYDSYESLYHALRRKNQEMRRTLTMLAKGQIGPEDIRLD